MLQLDPISDSMLIVAVIVLTTTVAIAESPRPFQARMPHSHKACAARAARAELALTDPPTGLKSVAAPGPGRRADGRRPTPTTVDGGRS